MQIGAMGRRGGGPTRCCTGPAPTVLVDGSESVPGEHSRGPAGERQVRWAACAITWTTEQDTTWKVAFGMKAHSGWAALAGSLDSME